MDKKRLKYWNSFFPEIKSEEIINEIIFKITGKTVENYAEDYEKVKKQICDWVYNEFFEDNILGEEENKRFRVLASKYNWTGFFVPILNKHYLKCREMIWRSRNIKNKEEFFDIFVSNLLEHMINMSFRVLVLETQIAKNEGMLEGSDSRQRGKDRKSVV